MRKQNPKIIELDAGVFVKDRDVANFTICTVDDPRSLNKTLYLRPNGNVCSMNDIVNMWETRIGKKLEKEYISEDELFQSIQGIYIYRITWINFTIFMQNCFVNFTLILPLQLFY